MKKERSEEDATLLDQDIFGEENEELVSPNSTSRTKDKTTFSEKQSADGIELMAEDILLIPPSD